MESRSTGAPSYDAQAKAFINAYIGERKKAIGYDDNEVIRKAHLRAWKAREDFKALVHSQAKSTDGRAGACNMLPLSTEEKYERCLESNRRSANATAVYRKVFDVELSNELSRLCDVTKSQEARIRELHSVTFRMEREKNELRARMLELEAAAGVRLDSPPVIDNGPLSMLVAAGDVEGQGAYFSAEKKQPASKSTVPVKLPVMHTNGAIGILPPPENSSSFSLLGFPYRSIGRHTTIPRLVQNSNTSHFEITHESVLRPLSVISPSLLEKRGGVMEPSIDSSPSKRKAYYETS